MKKILVIFILLFFMCGFSFAQNIKVTGVIPKTDTGKTYQLQIGAFRLSENVNQAKAILAKNGFTPQFETVNNLVRVFVVVKATEVKPAIDRLGRAGFKEVIIREYTVKQKTAETPLPPVTPAVTPPVSKPDSKVKIIPEEPFFEEEEEEEIFFYFEEELPDEPIELEEFYPDDNPVEEAEMPEHFMMHMYGGL